MEHKQYLKIVEQVLEHNDLYYNKDEPVISDSDYDNLFQSLLVYEEENPTKKIKNSPTDRIGAKPDPERKVVKLKGTMFSLKDYFSIEDLLKWVKKNEAVLKSSDREITYSCELKLDGMALELTYKDQTLVEGSTRGDGIHGESLIHNLKTIEGIPTTIDYKKDLVVRGEVYITHSAFDYINQNIAIDKPYKTARNAAAGIARQYRTPFELQRQLNFSAFDVLGSNLTQRKILSLLRKLDIGIAEGTEVVLGAQGIETFIEKVADIRESLPMGIDGVVVKLNEPEHRLMLGETGTAPRWAAAYKFPAAKNTSTLLDISYTVGRGGTVVPTAMIKPVDIGGVTVSRVNLYSRNRFEKYDLHEDDTLVVERAGDIIPIISCVETSLRNTLAPALKFPEDCPCCDSKLSTEGPHSICLNDQCSEKNINKLFYFASRPAFDIKGVGISIITKLYNNGFLETTEDFFKLETRKAELLESGIFTEDRINTLLTAIEKAKDITPHALLMSADIETLGNESIKTILKEHENLADLLSQTERSLESHGKKESHALLSDSILMRLRHHVTKITKYGVRLK